MLKDKKTVDYRYVVHVIIPIFIGGTIYLLFRSPKLLMFKWANLLRVSSKIDSFRQLLVTDNNFQIPDWTAFTLPDALWVYSLTAFMIITWENNLKNKNCLFWLSIGPLFGILPELGQMVGIVGGTFDRTDLVFCIIASIVPFIVFQSYFKGGNKNERKLV